MSKAFQRVEFAFWVLRFYARSIAYPCAYSPFSGGEHAVARYKKHTDTPTTSRIYVPQREAFRHV